MVALAVTLSRITPARAGKTSLDTVSRVDREDHPRACGENAPDGFTEAETKGSPPRVRGKRTDAHTV